MNIILTFSVCVIGSLISTFAFFFNFGDEIKTLTPSESNLPINLTSFTQKHCWTWRAQEFSQYIHFCLNQKKSSHHLSVFKWLSFILFFSYQNENYENWRLYRISFRCTFRRRKISTVHQQMRFCSTPRASLSRGECFCFSPASAPIKDNTGQEHLPACQSGSSGNRLQWDKRGRQRIKQGWGTDVSRGGGKVKRKNLSRSVVESTVSQ